MEKVVNLAAIFTFVKPLDFGFTGKKVLLQKVKLCLKKNGNVIKCLFKCNNFSMFYTILPQ